MSKVSIIGAGEVGASCAMCLAERDFVNEIVIIDIKQGLAEGKALDLRQSAALKRFDTIVKGVTNNYSAVFGSDAVVITSGITRKPGMERSDLISTNAGIVKEVSQQVAKYAPNCTIIVVSNPLDVLCYCALKSSGFPDNRVFPACAYLKGEYGYNDIYLGVPVIIGKNGVERVIELDLDEDDKIRFEQSKKEVEKTLDYIR